MARCRRLVAVVVALLGALLLDARLAVAQPRERAVDSASADALFRRAKALMEQEKYQEACIAFDSSFDLEPAIGTALNAANCYELLGRTATARARWSVGVELSRKRNDPRGAFAQERFDELSKIVPWLTIHVVNAGKVRGLVVRKGAVTLSAGAYGSELPTDPGPVSVLVLQGDDVLYSRTVDLKASEHRDVMLDLEKIYAEAPRDRKKLSEAEVELGGSAPAEPVRYWNGQRIAGLITGVAGIAAMGIGFGFGGAALGEKPTIEAECVPAARDTSYCSPVGRAAAQSTEINGHLAEGFIIGGAVITAVGITLFFAAPTPGGDLDERAEVPPVFGVGAYGNGSEAGISARGTF